jgi:hypothetical protein
MSGITDGGAGTVPTVAVVVNVSAGLPGMSGLLRPTTAGVTPSPNVMLFSSVYPGERGVIPWLADPVCVLSMMLLEEASEEGPAVILLKALDTGSPVPARTLLKSAVEELASVPDSPVGLAKPPCVSVRDWAQSRPIVLQTTTGKVRPS